MSDYIPNFSMTSMSVLSDVYATYEAADFDQHKSWGDNYGQLTPNYNLISTPSSLVDIFQFLSPKPIPSIKQCKGIIEVSKKFSNTKEAIIAHSYIDELLKDAVPDMNNPGFLNIMMRLGSIQKCEDLVNAMLLSRGSFHLTGMNLVLEACQTELFQGYKKYGDAYLRELTIESARKKDMHDVVYIMKSSPFPATVAFCVSKIWTVMVSLDIETNYMALGTAGLGWAIREHPEQRDLVYYAVSALAHSCSVDTERAMGVFKDEYEFILETISSRYPDDLEMLRSYNVFEQNFIKLGVELPPNRLRQIKPVCLTCKKDGCKSKECKQQQSSKNTDSSAQQSSKCSDTTLSGSKCTEVSGREECYDLNGKEFSDTHSSN